MEADRIYDYLERISNLIRMDARRSESFKGLQPVQLEALHYLASCNRYSNTPLAVAEYLGLTKGTVSQTLAVLENNGLIVKESDARDRRVVHVLLTETGRRLLDESIPPRVLRAALRAIPQDQRPLLESALAGVLQAMQVANRLKTFGACKSCRHHIVLEDASRRCGLTGERLFEEDAEMICREHQLPAGD
ncbi:MULTISPECIES: MarR family winged helix-turn-helix transcriptional regulator [Methylococcus]|jgi:DNA-binding MarR family transcriptional regulator|uniref:Transcriptional regulator, MarR family n=1 Tax=Methylococcus capsulatus TaxID=414 RepID=A0AA35XZ94_METCP|nr:MarR family transcriptional regulator [Methylococcus capsulatus]QXP87335.1 MarR family transcriptional regulator [Methylococcus capsulatus]QXP92924.1 MarR family transcriptional regulator [Methylococcus capsulatus]UQN12334.1 MarR family transcriptional regulator [Methylococcus capsulatus]CAI8854465.1 Transcriptional regulator, MarR family [Methylococcus capsulatus]